MTPSFGYEWATCCSAPLQHPGQAIGGDDAEVQHSVQEIRSTTNYGDLAFI